jgi:hypothetical protein
MRYLLRGGSGFSLPDKGKNLRIGLAGPAILLNELSDD